YKAFDDIAAAIPFARKPALRRAIAAGRNHRLAATLGNYIHERIAVVALVRDDILRFVLGQQRGCSIHIMFLAGSHNHFYRTAAGIDGQVQFRAEPATRPAQRFVSTPFFMAPAACWWARMIVESSIKHSK